MTKKIEAYLWPATDPYPKKPSSKGCPCGKRHKRSEAFFITAMDGGRTAFLAGPFQDHVKALELVDQARAIAEQVDRRAVFYAFGTVGVAKPLDGEPGLRPGVLNDKLGLSTTARYV